MQEDQMDLFWGDLVIGIEEETKEKSGLAELLNDYQDKRSALSSRITTLEENTKNLKAMISKMDAEIVDLFHTAGMTKFVAEDGTRYEVKEFWSASAHDGMEIDAFNWLEDHGFGGAVKTTLSFKDDKLLNKVMDAASELSVDVGYSKGIHPKTLAKIAEESEKAGSSLPSNIFKTSTFTTVKVKGV